MGQHPLSDRGWSGLLARLPDGLDPAEGASVSCKPLSTNAALPAGLRR